MLKLYLFNSTYEWDCSSAEGVIAESKQEAIEVYVKNNWTARAANCVKDLIVKEYSIKKNMLIKVYGYDSTYVEVEYSK